MKKDTLNEKQILGKKLFFDTKLSLNGTKACASCHDPNFAFTDGYRKSTGLEADVLDHNAPSLINAKYRKVLHWSNPNITTFEQQMLKPLFSITPKELGLDSNNKEYLSKFENDKEYKKLFKLAFPNDTTITYGSIIMAITEFVKTLNSFNSTYDNFVKGNKNAISASAKRGLELFNSDNYACNKCHVPPLFTDNNFYNIGLYFQYPSNDLGLSMFTNLSKDDGKFKTPSLRNVMNTSPYMHDGGIETINDVIDFLQWRLQESTKRHFDKRINYSEKDKLDIIEFLYTLTDTTISKNINFIENNKFENSKLDY